jgi:hypothetical protein
VSIVFHVMKEEYERLNQASQAYRANISLQIRGSVKIKPIGNNEYLYVQRREGQWVVQEYIGEIHSKKAISVLESISKRKKIEESLKKVLNDLKEVKKVLRGKI